MEENKANKKKTRNLSKPILIIFLLAVIAAALTIGMYAWAKYSSQIQSNATATVAKWNFNLVDGNLQTQEIDFLMTRTDQFDGVASGKIAPGTYGTIPISIDTTGTEVSYKYTLTATVTNCPTNLKFYEDAEHRVPIPTTRTETGSGDNKVKTATFTIQRFVPVGGAGIHNHTIYWDWPFEFAGNGNTVDQNNLIDTEDEGKTISFSVTTVGTQVMGQMNGTVGYLEFNSNVLTVAPNSTVQISASNGSAFNQVENITYSSSDTSVATVDSTGLITGVTEGNAVITMTGATSGEVRTIGVVVQIPRYTITFNATNGNGTITGTSSYIVKQGEALRNVMNSLPEVTYADANRDFKGWYTATSGGTEVTLSTMPSADTTYYAQYGAFRQVKYAVQIYGINQDVDSNGNTLGLTFGPAVGDDYRHKYVTHAYEEIAENPGNYKVKIITHTVGSNGNDTGTTEEYLTNSSGQEVTRTQEQVTARQGINLHTMSWAQIQAVQDKTVFEDCMLCGDTKSVRFTLNATLASGSTYSQYGDGTGMLYNTINDYYKRWNPSQSYNAYVGTGVTLNFYEKGYGSNASNAGGYSSSHIRATLVGKNAKTNEGYAGDVNLTPERSLYSCMESDLRNVITAKKVKYLTGTSTINDDISDPIWLFSYKEIYGVNTSTYNKEGLGSTNNEVGYAKFGNQESKYYMSSYTESSTNNRKVYYEAGSTFYWGLRSPVLNYNYKDSAYHVYSDGYIEGSYAASRNGLGLGFCIQ